MRISGNIKVLLLLVSIHWGLGGCTNDSEEELYGQPDLGNCDLSQVSYAVTVRPILQQHCYSCHGGGYAEGNVTLDDIDGVKQQLNNGKLLGSIRHLPGHPPMPQNGPKLSDCHIALIAKWYDTGAPNN
jgi:mono/diheme cytochrome c family protein